MQRKPSGRLIVKPARRKAPGKKSNAGRQTTKSVQSGAPRIEFRPRQPEDDAYIVHLTEEQLGSIHEQAFQEPFPREQFLRYLQSGAPTFIVLRNDKRIGYFSYLIGHDGTMHISAMVIEPQFQSDGIGTAVMKRLEADAVANGVRMLEVFVQAGNEKSLNFTRKLGFVEVYHVTPNTICFHKPIAPAQTAAMYPAPGVPYGAW